MCSEDGEKQVLIGNGKAADKNPNSDPPTSNISTSNASSTSDIHVFYDSMHFDSYKRIFQLFDGIRF